MRFNCGTLLSHWALRPNLYIFIFVFMVFMCLKTVSHAWIYVPVPEYWHTEWMYAWVLVPKYECNELVWAKWLCVWLLCLYEPFILATHSHSLSHTHMRSQAHQVCVCVFAHSTQSISAAPNFVLLLLPLPTSIQYNMPISLCYIISSCNIVHTGIR